MGDWPAYRWENMWDRPMHRSKLYSMVLQENSGTIFTELKFPHELGAGFLLAKACVCNGTGTGTTKCVEKQNN
jgi:hypothetical protein